MSMLTRFMSAVTEPQFMLARDLMALAIADGEITKDERQAISSICFIEDVDESQLMRQLENHGERFKVQMPQSRREKENYLKELILLIGADEYCSPQEVFLFQIIAGKMGLNQMDVVGLFLMTATHMYFRGDIGSKVLASFLKNYIDPIGRTEQQNRRGVQEIYETVAEQTQGLNPKEYSIALQENLSRTTELLKENQILMRDFRLIGVDFQGVLKEEEQRVLRQFSQHLV